jgi:hypothetical protein
VSAERCAVVGVVQTAYSSTRGDDGSTSFTGDMPINPSGGVLSSNPIGASGMIRFAESALQVRGAAGKHQVDGARRALGHAYGGGSQFFPCGSSAARSVEVAGDSELACSAGGDDLAVGLDGARQCLAVGHGCEDLTLVAE